jgi:S-DNA-T family DNA segregation ATPase FtsK/SpoIIIE
MAPKKPIKNTPKPEATPEVKPKAEKIKIPRDPNAPGIGTKIKTFFLDERTRLVMGICVLLGVLFILVSFISYFFTGAYDQSKMDLSWGEMQGVRNEIQNWGSVTGAIIAEVLINKWFGLASFAFAYFGIIIGLRLIRVNVTPVWKAFFYTSFWLIWASTLLGYILYPYYKDFLFFSPG